MFVFTFFWVIINPSKIPMAQRSSTRVRYERVAAWGPSPQPGALEVVVVNLNRRYVKHIFIKTSRVSPKKIRKVVDHNSGQNYKIYYTYDVLSIWVMAVLISSI